MAHLAATQKLVLPDSDQLYEKHYTVYELAALWSISPNTVRRLFENEPGVLVITRPKPNKRIHRTIRIPESVAQRVYRRSILLRCS
jgi:hypothetical protein